MKTSKPGKQQGQLDLRVYPIDKRLYVITNLLEYVKKTESVRAGHDALWLSYCKPFKLVSRDTISRWVKNVLKKAGAHGTRVTSTSAAESDNTPINTMTDAAGWSSESTFRKFYDKPIQKVVIFGDKILSPHRC